MIGLSFLFVMFWVVVCYLYANNAKNECPDLDVKPINYLVGGFLFGLFSWLWCWNKKRNYLKYRR